MGPGAGYVAVLSFEGGWLGSGKPVTVGSEGEPVIAERWHSLAAEIERFRCCECGRWPDMSEPLDEGLLDPWGYPMTGSGAREARIWLEGQAWEQVVDPQWAAHPVMVETVAEMGRYVELWPGEVCGDCWREWPGDESGA